MKLRHGEDDSHPGTCSAAIEDELCTEGLSRLGEGIRYTSKQARPM